MKKSLENLLSLNVGRANILAQNSQAVRKLYGNSILIDNHRTLLTAQDISNVKNEMLRQNWDINVREDAAKNLERFLGPNAGQTELTDACLHYQARTKDSDRLEIIISTPDQQEFAWRYGHGNLILLEGTFGVSKHKLLLFIMIVIDENNKGIPVTFFIFTPPPNNRLTAAGYNSRILERLLTIFRDKISAIRNAGKADDPLTFAPLVAMTDTDVKERGPLSRVWPGIFLLICHLHLAQCWKNEMNKRLGRGGNDSTILLRQTLKAYLRSILKEVRLMDCEEIVIRQFVIGRKESLEKLVGSAVDLSHDT